MTIMLPECVAMPPGIMRSIVIHLAFLVMLTSEITCAMCIVTVIIE